MFEGVDGSGKSTLKQEVINRLEQLKTLKHIEIVADAEKLIPTHPKREDRITKAKLYSELMRMALDTTTVYICDRGPISDIVYRVFDKYEPLTSLGELFMFMVRVDQIVVVYCDSDMSEELMLKRGEDNPVALQRHQELRKLYKQVMSMFLHVQYNVATMGNNLHIITNIILAQLWQNQKLKGDKENE
jgi:thymidylate kinase